MHKLLVRLIVLVSCSFFADVQAKDALVSSPDGTVTVAVGVKANKPFYTIKYGAKTIVAPSHLGFLLDKGSLGDDVKLTGKSYSSKDETWSQPWGETMVSASDIFCRVSVKVKSIVFRTN